MPPRQVRLRGKGRKERLVPIWSQTADALRRLHGMTAEDQRHVFVNRHGQPLTRDGVAYILAKHTHADLEPVETKPWKPTPDLLSFLQSL